MELNMIKVKNEKDLSIIFGTPTQTSSYRDLFQKWAEIAENVHQERLTIIKIFLYSLKPRKRKGIKKPRIKIRKFKNCYISGISHET